MKKKQKIVLFRIIISSILLLFANLFSKNILIIMFSIFSYLIIGYDILKKALYGIINKHPFDENFLMTVATLGAIFLSIYEKDYNYNEAIIVMLLYQIGELFQSIATNNSRKNIIALMNIAPDSANLELNNKIIKVKPEEVSIGSIIIVRPGEKIPLDGIVIDGDSTIDTSSLTGESLPKAVKKNCNVISGCINISGVLKIRTTKLYEESTVTKILDLVENASSNKSKSENFISKFAKVYTPFIVLCACILAIIPPFINFFLNNQFNFSTWIYRSLTFLVISCPCALVISIPLSFFSGLGGASKKGILIKGSNYIEALSKTDVVVFDKTGTLTQGIFIVKDIHHNKISDEKILEYAAYAESSSNHPIANSLKRAYNQEIDFKRVKDLKEISGKGIIAKVDEVLVTIGNEKLMEDFNIQFNRCHSEGTIVHIALNNNYAGHIVITDIEKRNSKEAIQKLKQIGIKKTIMLTGDVQSVANEISKKLEIDEVYSKLLPQDKVKKIEEIINKNKNNTIFVGDGINDAPVLARADIGIAMGALESDAAIEASDVVLMDDDPLKIVTAIKLSKKCMAIVYENIIFSLLIKFICLILGALGIANMPLAIFADVGVMILAILNSIRALKI